MSATAHSAGPSPWAPLNAPRICWWKADAEHLGDRPDHTDRKQHPSRVRTPINQQEAQHQLPRSGGEFMRRSMTVRALLCSVSFVAASAAAAQGGAATGTQT